MRNMKTGVLVLSICYLLVGLLLLVVPTASLPWICTAFSAVILVTGAYSLFRYFKMHGKGMGAPLAMVAGVVTTGLGIFALLRPDYVTWILPVVFGLFVVMDGIIRFSSAFQLLRRHGQKWWVLMLLAVLSLLLGIELVASPFLPFKILDIDPILQCGIILVLEGALNMGCAIYNAMELHALDRLKTATATVPVAAEITEGETVPEEAAQEPAANGEAPENAPVNPVDAAPEAEPADELPDVTGPVLEIPPEDPNKNTP